MVTHVPRWQPAGSGRWRRRKLGHEDWQHVTATDLRRLKAQFGVDWVILDAQRDGPGLPLPE